MRRTKLNFTEATPVMSLNKMPIRLTRHAMELGVVSYNCFLKARVDGMTEIALLRNMHPLDRSWFAKQLYAQKYYPKLKQQNLQKLIKLYNYGKHNSSFMYCINCFSRNRISIRLFVFSSNKHRAKRTKSNENF